MAVMMQHTPQRTCADAGFQPAMCNDTAAVNTSKAHVSGSTIKQTSTQNGDWHALALLKAGIAMLLKIGTVAAALSQALLPYDFPNACILEHT